MSHEELLAKAMRAKELDKDSSEGPWFAGSWSGRCYDKHDHNREVCDYTYTKVRGSGVAFSNRVNHYLTERSPSLPDSIFIAESRTLMPELAEAVIALTGENEKMKEALTRVAACYGHCPYHLGADDYKDPGVKMAQEIIFSMRDCAKETLADIEKEKS